MKRTIMVNVFPLPVCPYANTVPLYPSMTSVEVGMSSVRC